MCLLCQSSLHTQQSKPCLRRDGPFGGTSTHVASLQPGIGAAPHRHKDKLAVGDWHSWRTADGKIDTRDLQAALCCIVSC